MDYSNRTPGFTFTPLTIALSVIIGLVVGFGSLIFHITIQVMTDIFLGSTRYAPPNLTKEHTLIHLNTSLMLLGPLSEYLIILLPALGGLLSGILTYKLSPETEGAGTDMVIRMFHWERGYIRKRVAPIKIISSSILIGTGGSAGKQGPIAQIGAGLASIIATKLRLSDRERKLLVVAGMAAGVGSLFKSPFGGSIFGIEVLYKRDYEVQALIPAVIATFTAYMVFSTFVGWNPIFDTPKYSFTPIELPFFAILGLLAGVVARIYVKTFYKIKALFRKLGIPNYLKPALGGLLTGIIGFFIPQVLHTGYDWLQLAIWGKLTLELMVIIIIAKILTTSFSVGSGGSGGVFAPSVVIGGFLGGAFGALLSFIVPNLIPDIGVFVLVGMGCFFAAAAKVPLASIIMMAEMTGDYNLLPPAFLASVVAYIVSGEVSIYSEQLEMRFGSPFHEREVLIGLLSNIKIENKMREEVVLVDEDITLEELKRIFAEQNKLGIPVRSKEGKYIGIVTINDILSVPVDDWKRKKVKDIPSHSFVFVYPDNALLEVFLKMSKYELFEIPVVDRKSMKIIGTISLVDILSIL